MSGPGDLQTGDTAVYNPATTDIISRAYRILGVINEDETPSAGMTADGMDNLNAMIKELMATGIHLWTVEEAILFFQQYQGRYLLYQNGPSFCCDAYAWGLSSLGQNAPQGATSITLSGQYGYYPTVPPAIGTTRRADNARPRTRRASAYLGRSWPGSARASRTRSTTPMSSSTRRGNRFTSFTATLTRPTSFLRGTESLSSSTLDWRRLATALPRLPSES